MGSNPISPTNIEIHVIACVNVEKEYEYMLFDVFDLKSGNIYCTQKFGRLLEWLNGTVC